MTADREMLEMAAKAAGIKLHHWDGDTFVMVDQSTDDDGGWWNPKDDDGDAFRLAVKLELCVMTANLGKPTAYSCAEILADDRGWTEMHRNHRFDANAATRLAILRAAAQIGKEMK